jgi:hypothetical protein
MVDDLHLNVKKLEQESYSTLTANVYEQIPSTSS